MKGVNNRRIENILSFMAMEFYFLNSKYSPVIGALILHKDVKILYS